MIGTASEMLLFFAYRKETAAILGVTLERLRGIRTRVSNHNYSEEALVEMLEKLECKCIRPKYILPAVVKDKEGRIFTEQTFARTYFTQEFAEKWGVNYNRIMAALKRGMYMNKPLLKHLLRSKRAWIIEDRVELDSVWSYEPIETVMSDAKIVDVRRMLQIP